MCDDDDGADGDHYDDDGDDDNEDDFDDHDVGDDDDNDDRDDDDDDDDDADVGDDCGHRDDDDDVDDGDEDDDDDDGDDDDDHGDSEGQVRLLGGVTALPELSFAQNHCPALTLTFWFARGHVECHILMLFPWYGLFEFEQFFIYVCIVESTFNRDLGFPYDHVVPQV